MNAPVIGSPCPMLRPSLCHVGCTTGHFAVRQLAICFGVFCFWVEATGLGGPPEEHRWALRLGPGGEGLDCSNRSLTVLGFMVTGKRNVILVQRIGCGRRR